MRPERLYVVRRRWALVTVLALAVAGGSAIAAIAVHDGGGTGPAASRSSGSSPGTRAHSGSSSSPSGSPSPWLQVPSPIPGYLLLADRGNNRMLLVDSRHRILWMYPAPGTTPSFPFFFDDDTFFSKSYRTIISQQEDQHTIQIVSFPGRRVLWTYGHARVPGSSPGYLNTPDDAYLLSNGTVSVADVRNCRILFIARNHRIVRQLGTTGVCGHNPPRLFAGPNGDTPMPGGGTLVTEINGSWVDAISASGRLLWSIHALVRYPSDAQWLGHGRILLADYSNPGHVLIMNTAGRVLWRYGPPWGEGALNHPSLALMLPNGLIAVNDDFRDRVVLISMRLNRIVWQFGHTDWGGTAPGFLHTPDGMDFLPFSVAMGDPVLRRLVTAPR
jgi:hypothetical protein